MVQILAVVNAVETADEVAMAKEVLAKVPV
jgi:hypothetical protein